MAHYWVEGVEVGEIGRLLQFLGHEDKERASMTITLLGPERYNKTCRVELWEFLVADVL